MNRLSLSAIALVLASPVYAGGTVAPAPIVIVEPIVEETWTGWYGGLQYDSIVDDTVSAAGAGSTSFNMTGSNIVLFGGYRRDFGNWVVGGELDVSVSGDLDGGGFAPGTDFGISRAGVEVGYDLGRALVYGTVGANQVELGTANETGVFYGLGVDYMVTDSITVGAEVLQHSVSDFNGNAGVDVDILTAGINVAYRF